MSNSFSPQKVSKSPMQTKLGSIWKSEWDHNFKHKLNEELKERRIYYKRRFCNNQSVNYFGMFEKIPFQEYVKRTSEKSPNSLRISVAQLQRNLKNKQFSLNSLIVDQQQNESKITSGDLSPIDDRISNEAISTGFRFKQTLYRQSPSRLQRSDRALNIRPFKISPMRQLNTTQRPALYQKISSTRRLKSEM